MFDQTFVQGRDADKKPLTLAFSLLLQTTVIGLLTLAPLLYTQVPPTAVFKNLLLAPSPPRAAVPEPKPRSELSTRTLRLNQLFAPISIPTKTITMDQFTAPDIGIAGGTADANVANAAGFGGIVGSMPVPPPPVEPAPAGKKATTKPVQVASVLQEANLVRRVMPVYPPLAKSARVQGTVEFTALISKDGRVENLQLVHGHPLLVQAAREAIEQWRYRPTILNGVPVEVLTDIIVNFTLNQ
jgi:protein TonB